MLIERHREVLKKGVLTQILLVANGRFYLAKAISLAAPVDCLF